MSLLKNRSASFAAGRLTAVFGVLVLIGGGTTPPPTPGTPPPLSGDELKTAIDDVFGTFDPVTIDDSRDQQIELPEAGMLACSADGMNFTLVLEDGRGNPLREMGMSELPDRFVSFGLAGSDLANAAKLSIRAGVNYNLLLLPFSECPELGAGGQGNSAEGEVCMIYGGVGETRTIQFDSAITIQEFISSDSATVVLEETPIETRTSQESSFTLQAGPSVLIIDSHGAWSLASNP